MVSAGASMGGENDSADRVTDGIPSRPSYAGLHKEIAIFEINRLSKKIVDVQKNAIKSFDDAMEKLWRRAVGDWIEVNRDRMGISQGQLAEIIRVDASAVNKWINGESSISQKNLLKLQIRFGENHFPLKTPTSTELALEGYRAAVAYTRSELTGKEMAPPKGEEVLCLLHVYSGPDWAQKRIDDERDCRLRDLARSILERAGVARGLVEAGEDRPCRIAEGAAHACSKEWRCPNLDGVKWINDVISRWGTAWLVCIDLLTDEGTI